MAVTNFNGAEAYEKMRLLNTLEDELFKFFHFDCEVWKSIQNHIVHANNCVIIKRDAPIKVYSSSYGISLRGMTAYGDQYTQDENYKTVVVKPNVFQIEFVVEYNLDHHEDDEIEYAFEAEGWFKIDVPLILLTNFSHVEFEKWIMKLAEKRQKEEEVEVSEELARLIKKHPEQAKALIGKL